MTTIESTETHPNGYGTEEPAPGEKKKRPRPPVGWEDVEVVKVGEMEACLHAALIDDGEQPARVINVANGATVKARVELIGELWRCTCGSIRFTADFSGGADAADFLLRETVDFDGAKSRIVEVELPVTRKQFGIDDDVADYRVSVTALILDTTGRPLSMAGGVNLGYFAAYEAQ